MELKECKLASDFIEYFDNDEQAFKHTNYYHYTSIGNANKIFMSKQLWLNPLSKTANDCIERKIYEKLGGNIFSLCLSTGTSESLPLWYLYGGIDGNGARIGLSKKTTKKLIKHGNLFLKENDIPSEGKIMKLNEGEYKIQFRDVLYIGTDPQKEGIYRIKHNGTAVNNINSDVAEEIRKKYQRFVKGLIWFYEKETRIQVEITKKTLIDPNKKYVVAIDLSDVYDEISLRLAPEYGEIEPDLFDEYEGIKNWALHRIQKSDFSGQIRMNLSNHLCKECKEKSLS